MVGLGLWVVVGGVVGGGWQVLKYFVLRKCLVGSFIGCIRHLTPLPCIELVNKCGGWLVVGGWWWVGGGWVVGVP